MDYPKSDPRVGLHNGKFTDGSADGTVKPSRDTAAHANALTDEILNVIRAGKLVPDEGDVGQMAQSIQVMIAAAIAANTPNLSAYLRYNASAVLEAGFWTKPVVLTINAGVATADLAAGNVFTPAAPLSANLTLGFPAEAEGKAGMFLVVLKQDATGGRTLTLAPGYRVAGGSWSTTAGAVNLLWVTSDGSGAALDVVISQRGAG
ncbi:hypothetical protein [Magnetospirillum fulvum]|uniref:Uncharacterized protein n=1 Tax=Magnetospirillum fulvum MGU-K5 TaxID=1316936 RepID=S9S9G9_MAGFU|nr:hypothetical protein [Magnetospirillum fulvum]EPY01344.1 hypothetical protein K678_11493 [Magnetospirillum fulvum MGU-K5]